MNGFLGGVKMAGAADETMEIEVFDQIIAEFQKGVNEENAQEMFDEQKFQEMKLELDLRKEQLDETRIELNNLKLQYHVTKTELEEMKKFKEGANKKMKLMNQQIQLMENKIKVNTDVNNKSSEAREFEEKVNEISSLKELTKSLITKNCELEQNNEELKLKNKWNEFYLRERKEEQDTLKKLITKIHKYMQVVDNDKIQELRETVMESSKKCDELFKSMDELANVQDKLLNTEQQLLFQKAKNNIYEQFMNNFKYFHPEKEAEYLLEQWQRTVQQANQEQAIQEEIIENLNKELQVKTEIISLCYENDPQHRDPESQISNGENENITSSAENA